MINVTETEKKVAMATSRARGAVGRNAVVPKVVRQYIIPGESILDYGCGKDAAHVADLVAEGYKAVGYDFHLPETLINLQAQYDCVYLSNVVNVQGSKAMLEATLRQAWACVADGGVLILNVPTEPRKGAYEGLTIAEGNRMVYDLMTRIHGGGIQGLGTRCNPSGPAPVWKWIKD